MSRTQQLRALLATGSRCDWEIPDHQPLSVWCYAGDGTHIIATFFDYTANAKKAAAAVNALPALLDVAEAARDVLDARRAFCEALKDGSDLGEKTDAVSDATIRLEAAIAKLESKP
jgi:hypothetical protein